MVLRRAGFEVADGVVGERERSAKSRLSRLAVR